jgi:hypothetical protein
LLQSSDAKKSSSVMKAMLSMVKIDVGALEKAYAEG